jgi:superfamily II DNA/RNA helicase
VNPTTTPVLHADAPTRPPGFADLGVPPSVVDALSRGGITEPFPVQAMVLPDALAGRDVCGRAPTGSGKTIAFGIPLVVGLERARPRHPRRLVLVPTRELASQVADELRMLASGSRTRIEAVYGGVPIGRQAAALRAGVEILVACPGRLADLLNQGLADLGEVDMVVLDEADRMADMGFLPEVRRLLARCPRQRRTVLFSATLDGDVDVLIREHQHRPVHHEVVAVEERAADVSHHFWAVERTDRVRVTATVVDRSGPTVVFCRTKRGADRVARQLGSWGVSAAAIHGDRSQGQRERALAAFRDGSVQALVATDVAARGIHVDDVAAVVHFDPPADHKDYVHRSGRTGRAGGRGVVVTLVAPEVAADVTTLRRRLGQSGPLTQPDPSSLPGDGSGPAAPARRSPQTPTRTTAQPARTGTRTARPARPGPVARPSSRGPRTATANGTDGNGNDRNGSGGNKNRNGNRKRSGGAGRPTSANRRRSR